MTPKQRQAKRILEWLQTGRSITSDQAMMLYNCHRLAARIYDLRRYHVIRTVMVRSENGNGYAQYRYEGPKI